MTKALDLALSLQSAGKKSQAMHPGRLSGGRVGLLTTGTKGLLTTTAAMSPLCQIRHASSQCKFKHATCHLCSKQGHIVPASMRQKKGSQGRPTEHSGVKPKRDTKWLHTNEMHDSELLLFNVTSQSSLLVLIDLQLNEKNLVMELDTGFAVLLIFKSTYDKLF